MSPTIFLYVLLSEPLDNFNKTTIPLCQQNTPETEVPS